ncbi:MAG: TolC family protein [Planctomycetales bacterium]|nr:TolC family protein [Planctomycetales bacterium]
MRNRECMLLYLFVVLLFAGCSDPYTTGINRETTQDVIGSRLKSAPSPDSRFEDEMAAVTEPNGILTLREALALTLVNNPELKVFSLETRAAEARALQAGLWPNPELEIEVEDVGGSGARSGFDAAETTIQLSQLIEFGNKAQKRKNVASVEKDLSGWDYEAKRLEVLTEASKAFVELLAMQEKTKLLRELVDISERSLGSVSHRVAAGKDSPLEKTKASVALSSVRLEYNQVLQELEKARNVTASFWGSERSRFMRAEGQLETVSDIPESDALRQMLVQNPQLARWEKEIARDKAALELENSKTQPDIAIGAGVKRFNEFDDNAFVFGVSIPLPISDRNQGARMEATVNLSKSYEERRAARIEVMNRFNQIFTELSVSFNKIKELRASILPGARDVFDASQIAYAEGKIDYLNVLDAQRTYFVSQTEYLETLVAYHKAKTDIEGLVGQTIDKTEPIQQPSQKEHGNEK